MYKIKHLSKNVKRLLLTVFFAVTVSGALFCVLRIVNLKEDIRELEKEYGLLNLKYGEMTKDSGESREVWLDFVDFTGFFEVGDRIDVHIVSRTGEDEKLLSDRTIKGIGDEGFQLLVSEDDLSKLSLTEHGLSEGGIKKAYAVKMP